MDLGEVESRARLFLKVAPQFRGPFDATSLATVAANRDPGWMSDPQEVRLNGRALELLQRLRLVDKLPGQEVYEVTGRGRQAAEGSWPSNYGQTWLEEWIQTEELLELLAAQRTSSTNTVTELVVRGWRQFDDVGLIFHPRLTVLTGANGAGKTTLLSILAPHFNWPVQLLTKQNVHNSASTSSEVGYLKYSNGSRTSIVQNPAIGVANSPLGLTQMSAVPGLFINSHRSISTYHPLQALPPRFSEWETLQQQFAAEIQVRYSGGSSQHSPLYRMKEALVAAAMYAYGNKAVRASPAAREVWEDYQEVLRNFLPRSLEFKQLEVDEAEIIVGTRTTEFPLEAVSGGVSAMLELSWQIFLRQRNQESFTVCIDEPENHLHPELQRAIVPSLLEAFPNVTFIVATHSPLVVTSARDAFVYALTPGGKGVSSRRVDVNASATSDETLVSVLGLDSPLPMWAEDRLEQLLVGLGEAPSPDELRRFRDELRALGLDRQFPAAVRSITASD